MGLVADFLIFIGAVLVVTGLSFWSYQLALIVSGLLIGVVGWQVSKLANSQGSKISESD